MTESGKLWLQKGQEFQNLQEERVKTYAILQAAHKKYLNTAPDYQFEPYREEVAKATKAFSSISEKILAIRDDLDDSILTQSIDEVKESLR